MDTLPLLGPMLTQMGLMLIVSVWLVWARVGSVVRKKVDMRDVAKTGWQGWIKNAGDNYGNQYEMPLLFFVMCFTFVITNTVTALVVALAWIYVVFRITHALIHLIYNNVTHRFLAFFASALTLIALFVCLVAGLI